MWKISQNSQIKKAECDDVCNADAPNMAIVRNANKAAEARCAGLCTLCFFFYVLKIIELMGAQALATKWCVLTNQFSQLTTKLQFRQWY